MEPVRLGVVGLGWFGGVLTDAARATQQAAVVACFARSPDSRRTFAAEHGCRAVDSFDAMLAAGDVKGVILATPHSTHAEMIVAAAEAGKHVFVEKPLTLSVADTKRAIAACAKAGVVLQVGLNRRRHPANRRVKEFVASGQLGTVLQLEGNQSGPGAKSPTFPAWRADPAECPAGGMTAMGIHIVDTFHHLVGPARRISAFSKRVEKWRDIDESTVVLIEYEAGPLGMIGTSYYVPPVNTIALYGSEGNAWVEQDGSRLFRQRMGEQARSEEPVETIDTIGDELAEFARCIRDGGEPETGGEASLEVAVVLEGVVESTRTGGAVDLAALR
jgi:predicted dehydrogenase